VSVETLTIAHTDFDKSIAKKGAVIKIEAFSSIMTVNFEYCTFSNLYANTFGSVAYVISEYADLKFTVSDSTIRYAFTRGRNSGAFHFLEDDLEG
jgi:hypothetical protein